MYGQQAAALLLGAALRIQAKPEKAITLPDLLSPYISDFRAYEPDLNSCKDALVAVDENGDSTIHEHEYIRLIGGLSNGAILAIDYDDLPLATRLNFVYLSCVCEDKKCCKGAYSSTSISIFGICELILGVYSFLVRRHREGHSHY